MSQFKNQKTYKLPREKLKNTEQLNEVELLALIIEKGYKGVSVMQLAQKLIENYNGLENVIEQSMEELMTNKGIGQAKAAKIKGLQQIIVWVNNHAQSQVINKITHPQDVYQLNKKYAYSTKEYLIVVCLNHKGEVVINKEIQIGTATEIIFDVKEIYAVAIHHQASKIIIVHNHPSGDVTPSVADLQTTKKIKEIGEVVGVFLIDHVIIGKEKYLSIKENFDII